MNKTILAEYIDACALVKETERELRKLKSKKNNTVEGVVKGSNPDFPYQLQHFHIAGMEFDYEDDKHQRRIERMLEERKEKAEEIKIQTEEWMNEIPMRMQRIIKYKIFEGLSWEETAVRMGRKATGNSIRMEMERFLKEK